ncbi:MAG: rhodanese-like domain-containing protein [Thermoplasmatota archaeon]|nr:rhodanese-like domain-containing protein [Halobacteriales archaeon]
MPQRVEAGWLQRRLEEGEAVLLDVAPPPQFAAGHVPGSLSVPADVPGFAARVHGLVPDHVTPIVVYADGDVHAVGQAARALEMVGYQRVFEFRSGLAGWQRTGHVVERSPAQAKTL